MATLLTSLQPIRQLGLLLRRPMLQHFASIVIASPVSFFKHLVVSRWPFKKSSDVVANSSPPSMTPILPPTRNNMASSMRPSTSQKLHASAPVTLLSSHSMSAIPPVLSSSASRNTSAAPGMTSVMEIAHSPSSTRFSAIPPQTAWSSSRWKRSSSKGSQRHSPPSQPPTRRLLHPSPRQAYHSLLPCPLPTPPPPLTP
ncbi:hypothetical protein Agub_g10513, partial [Astrephomene gubernaculifera]